MLIIAILSAILFLCWILLLIMANKDDRKSATEGKIFKITDELTKLLKTKTNKNSKKMIKNLEQKMKTMKDENYKHSKYSSFIILPGYVILRIFNKFFIINRLQTHMKRYLDYFGQETENRIKYVMAKIISYTMLWIPLSISMAISFVSLRKTTDEYFFPLICFLFIIVVFVLIYSIYNQIKINAKTHNENIKKQLPHALTTLSMLINSGMVVSNAWEVTAFSHMLELHIEMQKTCHEIKSGIFPKIAYKNFEQRCGKSIEIQKLVSAMILQHELGNEHIHLSFKEMANNAWYERLQIAKREITNIQAKLLLPTMILLFIVVGMVMGSVLIGFLGVDFPGMPTIP
jgi:Flp pilus assembly protein TadB